MPCFAFRALCFYWHNDLTLCECHHACVCVSVTYVLNITSILQHQSCLQPPNLQISCSCHVLLLCFININKMPPPAPRSEPQCNEKLIIFCLALVYFYCSLSSKHFMDAGSKGIMIYKKLQIEYPEEISVREKLPSHLRGCLPNISD